MAQTFIHVTVGMVGIGSEWCACLHMVHIPDKLAVDEVAPVPFEFVQVVAEVSCAHCPGSEVAGFFQF